jgi:Spy/CpxP family protein refolding chaperone
MTGSKLIFSISTLALFFALTPATRAQNAGASAPPPAGSAMTAKPGHGGGAAMDPDNPDNDATLNLTDDQKTKIQAIRADAKDQLKAVNKDTSLTDDQRAQKVKELRKDTRRQVWAVMTPEQQKAWAQEMREKRLAKKGDGSGASTPQ